MQLFSILKFDNIKSTLTDGDYYFSDQLTFERSDYGKKINSFNLME